MDPFRPSMASFTDYSPQVGLPYAFTMRHNSRGAFVIMNLTIEVPDDIVRSLEVIAAAQGKSLQQLAAERLNSLVNVSPAPLQGSPAALLRAMTEPPHPSAADVDDL